MTTKNFSHLKIQIKKNYAQIHTILLKNNINKYYGINNLFWIKSFNNKLLFPKLISIINRIYQCQCYNKIVKTKTIAIPATILLKKSYKLSSFNNLMEILIYNGLINIINITLHNYCKQVKI